MPAYLYRNFIYIVTISRLSLSNGMTIQVSSDDRVVVL